MNKSEQLIACLEGEIAKRDETIARLEPQLNRAIQANYDLREELAACRVAVENCELFRARIAELEAENENLAAAVRVSQQTAVAVSKELRAELAAIKAQEPVAWAGVIEDCASLFVTEPQLWKAIPLYAAPVSEAKAQGVVQWPEADEIMQMAFEEGQPADDASGYCFELEEFDLFIERLMSEVARLNAAPAAPAADAGLVEALDYQVLFDAIAAATSVYANGAVNISVQAFRDALAAHRAKGVV